MSGNYNQNQPFPPVNGDPNQPPYPNQPLPGQYPNQQQPQQPYYGQPNPNPYPPQQPPYYNPQQQYPPQQQPYGQPNPNPYPPQQPPYVQAGYNYNPQQINSNPAGKVAKTSRGAGNIILGLLIGRRPIIGIIRLIVLVIIVGSGILFAVGVFSNVEAPDYPGAKKSSLTSDGQTIANNLYKNNKADTENQKVFVTNDSTAQVTDFYKNKLTKDGWKTVEEDTTDGVSYAQYMKDKTAIVLITGPGAAGMVKDGKDNNNFIVLLTGSTS